MLSIGSLAPDFSLQNQDGELCSLSDSRGSWVVIYFYPKDDTPGCTKEACTIAEVFDEFETLHTTVFGVSRDSVASHKKFAEKYGLPFTLLSDLEGKMIVKYGALKEKNMFGKQVIGIVRMTYVINPEGKIAKVYPKVTPTDHALELLTDLKALL